MITGGGDIATRSGVAFLDGTRFVHGEAFRPRGDTDGAIFHGFRGHFRRLLLAHGVEHFALEEPLRTGITRVEADGTEVPQSTMATYLRLYGLFGIAQEVCDSLNIPCEVVHQGTWRAAFLGNGRGDKEMSLAQCKLLGFPVKSKDVAEAVGVAWWLNGQLGLGRAGELAIAAPQAGTTRIGRAA
jgi:hypothetical protein